jgi:hypothetical protein
MSYGRNFEVIVPPHGRERRGRFFLDGAELPIGAPVSYGLGGTLGAPNDLDLQPVTSVAGDVAPTELSGIAVYEYGPNAYAGDDEVLTNYSDKDTVPAGAAVQVIRGEAVKVRFKNTVAETFLNSRSYTGRTMVDLTGIIVGDLLQPEATPNDTNGYWQEAVTPANAWLVVTKVDSARAELEAQMTF